MSLYRLTPVPPLKRLKYINFNVPIFSINFPQLLSYRYNGREAYLLFPCDVSIKYSDDIINSELDAIYEFGIDVNNPVEFRFSYFYNQPPNPAILVFSAARASTITISPFLPTSLIFYPLALRVLVDDIDIKGITKDISKLLNKFVSKRIAAIDSQFGLLLQTASSSSNSYIIDSYYNSIINNCSLVNNGYILTDKSFFKNYIALSNEIIDIINKYIPKIDNDTLSYILSAIKPYIPSSRPVAVHYRICTNIGDYFFL